MLFRIFLSIIMSLSFSIASAKANDKKGETYRDLIAKAQNLSLQKDRQQAINILLAALHKETKPAAVTELKRAVVDISHMFFSDKAQQIFEIAVSVKKNDTNQALDKLAEAAKIEPENMSIVLEQARLLIRKDDCRQAIEILNKRPRLQAVDEEYALVSAQAYTCLERWTEFTALYTENKKNLSDKFWMILETQKLISEKQFLKAQEVLSHVLKGDAVYPEAHYWEYRLRQLQKINTAETGLRYLANCKNISAVQYRKYMLDPMLCSRLQTIENEMKGANAN